MLKLTWYPFYQKNEVYVAMVFKYEIINKFTNENIIQHKKNTLDFIVAILEYDDISKWIEIVQTFFMM